MQILESSRPIRNVNTLSLTHIQAGGSDRLRSRHGHGHSRPARVGTSMRVHVRVRISCVRVPRVGFPSYSVYAFFGALVRCSLSLASNFALSVPALPQLILHVKENSWDRAGDNSRVNVYSRTLLPRLKLQCISLEK